MAQGKGERALGLEWAIEVVRWADEQGIDLTPDAELFPYVRVVLWARTLRQPPTFESIAARWGVSNATGYRWLHHLREVHQAAAARAPAPVGARP